MSRHGCAASADTRVVENYTHHFKTTTQKNDFCSHQVFNCDETGLFWKGMPRRTYSTLFRKRRKMPGHKPVKDRLALLLDANAGASG